MVGSRTLRILVSDNKRYLIRRFKRTGKRDQIFLASKFGVNRQTMTIDCSPEYARQQVENSLRRLGVDYIDLYYLHRQVFALPKNTHFCDFLLLVQIVRFPLNSQLAPSRNSSSLSTFE